MRVRVRLDDAKVRAFVRATTSDASRRGAQAAVRKARHNLLTATPPRHNTGALSRSIKATRTRQTDTVSTWRVGSDLSYALYQEKGFGPVYPVRAKFLRFTPKGSGVVVFAKRTRGLVGAHYLEKAVNQLRLEDFVR